MTNKPGPFPWLLARVGGLGPNEDNSLPELGRSPFWERSSHALPDLEEAPASAASRPPVGRLSTKAPRVTGRV